jgi:hypothetical protein
VALSTNSARPKQRAVRAWGGWRLGWWKEIEFCVRVSDALELDVDVDSERVKFLGERVNESADLLRVGYL